MYQFSSCGSSFQDKQLKSDSGQRTDAAILAEHKKKEREAAKKGKQPFYLSKGNVTSSWLHLSLSPGEQFSVLLESMSLTVEKQVTCQILMTSLSQLCYVDILKIRILKRKEETTSNLP